MESFEELEFSRDYFLEPTDDENKKRWKYDFWIGPGWNLESVGDEIKIFQEKLNGRQLRRRGVGTENFQQVDIFNLPFDDPKHESFYQMMINNDEEKIKQFIKDFERDIGEGNQEHQDFKTKQEEQLRKREHTLFLQKQRQLQDEAEEKKEEEIRNRELLIKQKIDEIKNKILLLQQQQKSLETELQNLNVLKRQKTSTEGISGLYCSKCHRPFL
jgi:hypothetical protein